MRLHPTPLGAIFAIGFVFIPQAVHSSPIQECQLRSTSPFARLTHSILRNIWPFGQPLKKCVSPSSPTLDLFSEDIVLRFNITTADDAHALIKAADKYFWDIWEFNANWADVRVNRDLLNYLPDILPKSLHQSAVPLIPESTLKSLLSAAPDPSHYPSFTSSKKSTKEFFFNDYQPLSVIYPWLKLLASMFSTHARLVTVGKTFEGRDILGLRLGVTPKDGDEPSGPRKTILVTGGAHAREWISVSSVNYLLYNMVTTYGQSATNTLLINEFDWVFVPVLNPDGYDYTWQGDRLWKKNRQPTYLRFCNGLDLDRSYGYQFDTGAGDNPCGESFPGQDAWEAVEASSMKQWALNQTESGTEFIAFLDLHSYSQQILFPYAYSCDDAPPTLENLQELAYGLSKAMRLSSPQNLVYKVAPACEGNVAVNEDGSVTQLPSLRNNGGSALDWFYHEIRVKYAYQIKLRDTGTYGFLLPKEHIIPTGKEVFGAVNYLGRFLLGEIGITVNDEDTLMTKEVDDESLETKLEFRRRKR
jgi:extracellular matrix protein 14